MRILGGNVVVSTTDTGAVKTMDQLIIPDAKQN